MLASRLRVFSSIALGLAVGGCGGGSTTIAPPPPTTAGSAAPPPAASTATSAPPPPVFTAGCPEGTKSVRGERIDLAATRDVSRWAWACRAKVAFGDPELRTSGYPTTRVRDAETGTCLTISIEEVGAFVYHAPTGRGEALRTELGKVPPSDCSFELGLDGAGPWPIRAGVRDGKPFEEPVYAVTTMAGARAWFEAHPEARSASNLLGLVLALPAKERPAELADLVARAVGIELDELERMETGWLSPIGLEGYCARAKDLASLQPKAPNDERLAAAKARFCKNPRKR